MRSADPDARGRAEAAQRVAWIYYVLGRDADARRVADRPRRARPANGPRRRTGSPASPRGGWTTATPPRGFRAVAGGRAASANSAPAALIGRRARSRPAAGREAVAAAAAWPRRASPESFYGLLARETLGMDNDACPRRAADAPAAVERARPTSAAPRELVAIGELAWPTRCFATRRKIGSPADHHALIALARGSTSPARNIGWRTTASRARASPPPTAIPTPRWTPERGWRIDPALAFAHVLQESDFRAGAVSPAGAVGLMQVRPGTAGDFARGRGEHSARLTSSDPPTNLEYGQSFIEMMPRLGGDRGPAAQGHRRLQCRAGAGRPLELHQRQGRSFAVDRELPYWETRYYVPAVLRNMWVYQGLAGGQQPTLRALAEHQWPAFPTARRGWHADDCNLGLRYRLDRLNRQPGGCS